MLEITRRSLNQALLATAARSPCGAGPAQQLKSLKITAPAGPAAATTSSRGRCRKC